MTKRKKISYTILVLVIILLSGFFYVKNWYNSTINSSLSEEETLELVVEEGETFLDVIGKLESEGYVKSTDAVRIYLRVNGLSPNIKAGNYSIAGDTNIPKLIDILEQGALKPNVTVRIAEGLRYEEIADVLEENLSSTTEFNKAEFLSIAKDPDTNVFTEEIQSFLNTHKPEGESLRGFLYPDTYLIDEGSSTKEIVEVILSNFIEKIENNVDLDSLTATQNELTSLYDGMILASIIEKEASAWDDRAEISGVFHNRLVIGNVLNSDATVNFITGKNQAGVEFADTKIDSPYNTYLYPGIPPTPINNPRIESIVAALNPNDTNYFYFYHTPDGQTFYNEDLAGHSNGVCRDLGC